MSHRKTYNRVWENLSRVFLANHPFCATPGCRKASVAVDHIVPIKVAPYRRLDPGNFQALCHGCHNRITAAYEKGSIAGACDLDGMPLDPAHPWAQADNKAAIDTANKKRTVEPALAARLKAKASGKS